MRTALLAFVVVGGLAAISGCATNRAGASADPALHCEAIKTLHVRFRNGDERGTQGLIVDAFRARGFAVTADPAPDPRADAVVTYREQWIWDITWYMLELAVTLREPQTDFPLASGNSLHTSLTRKAPREMVDEVVGNLLMQCR
jgi:hypothetical protein